MEEIDRSVSSLSAELIRLRRDFHSHPELGLQERRTAGIVSDYLERLGIEVRKGVGGTGVVGLLRGDAPGRTLMLRADMDALPIQEKNDVPYRSMNDGVMHACGHDGHTAILLGTASVLSAQRHRLAGRIKFVFQPAEESTGGARTMIDEGVLENPRVDAAFGLHLATFLPTGFIAWCRGPMMAAMDTFTLRIRGLSGHAAMPEGSIDAIRAGSQVVLDLRKLTVRDASPLFSSLVNVGTIKGGCAANVVAEEVELTGTVRTMDRNIRLSFPASMEKTVSESLAETKASYELDYRFGCPPVVNDPEMTDLLCSVVRESPWKEGLVEMPPVMASEDMACYLECVPGCFFFLSAGNPEKGLTNPMHSPRFDFDESALVIGTTVFSRLALTYLRSR